MKVTFSKSTFWFLTNPKNGSRSASLLKVETSVLFIFWDFMERNSFSSIQVQHKYQYKNIVVRDHDSRKDYEKNYLSSQSYQVSLVDVLAIKNFNHY